MKEVEKRQKKAKKQHLKSQAYFGAASARGGGSMNAMECKLACQQCDNCECTFNGVDVSNMIDIEPLETPMPPMPDGPFTPGGAPMIPQVPGMPPVPPPVPPLPPMPPPAPTIKQTRLGLSVGRYSVWYSWKCNVIEQVWIQ